MRSDQLGVVVGSIGLELQQGLGNGAVQARTSPAQDALVSDLADYVAAEDPEPVIAVAGSDDQLGGGEFGEGRLERIGNGGD